MANVLDIRRRIRSVRSTRQITKAMKMISTARLRKAQDRALAARPYAQMLTNVLKSLVKRVEVIDPDTGKAKHPLLEIREEKTIQLIIVTADKGLAGAFNTNVLKAASRFMQTKSDKNIDIAAIGRKARDFSRRRFPQRPENSETRVGRVQLTAERVGLGNIEFALAREMAENVIDRYCKGEIDAVYLVFNEFKSVIAQRIVVDRILPIEEIGEIDVRQAEELSKKDREAAAQAAAASGISLEAADTSAIDEHAAQFGTAQVDYIYEQPPKELFEGLLPKYVAVQIFRALLESNAAEQAARMTAMESATNNASDLIDSLTLKMNRARQASITKEIIEIVSGAAAL
ncbi:MAG TPA: ATP synthase F1 subunit gamma [Terriglobales bacterium]|nr:ATP synthase F1 subunit gamma [Terriglobales bacterium]